MEEEGGSIETPQPPPRKYKFFQAVVSDVGLKREENQDSYGYAHTDRVSFYIVADGMGGARGGATASAIAVETALRYSFSENGIITEDSLRDALEYCNQVIFEKSREDPALTGMGTTIVALAFMGDRAIVAHVGDSRIYHIRDGKLEQLTRDHTLVQELVESGAIRPEDAAHHPIAHMLTRSLGPSASVQPEVAIVPFQVQPGDQFLLCSDGMYNLVDAEEIRSIVSEQSPDDAVRALLELVLDRGASDNTTIQLIRSHELDDASVEASIPEPKKIRVVTSSFLTDELPPAAVLDEDEVLEQPPVVELHADDAESAHHTASNFATLPGEDDAPSGFLVADEDLRSETHDPEASEFILQETSDQPSRPSGDEINAEVEHEHAAYATRPASARSLDSESAISPAATSVASSINKSWLIGGGLLCGLVLAVIVSSTKPEAPVRVVNVQPSAVLTPAPSLEPAPTESASSSPAGETAPSLATVTPVPADVVTPDGEGAVNGAWPKIAVLENASDVAPTIAPTVMPTESASPEPTPYVAEEVQKPSSLDTYRDVLAAASVQSVGPAPTVKGAESGRVAPINWAREQAERESLEPEQGAIAVSGLLLTDDEKRDAAKRKIELRESIADLDLKFLAFDSRTPEEIRQRESEVQNKLTDARTALDEVRAEHESQRTRFEALKANRLRLSGTNVPRVAAEYGPSDGAIQQRIDEYNLVAGKYQRAREAWNENPRDLAKTAEMSALDREKNDKLSALELATRTRIDRDLEAVRAELVPLSLSLEDLERFVQRLHRHIGFLRGAEPNMDNKNNKILQRNTDERRNLNEELANVTRRFTDYAESEYRRRQQESSIALGQE
ncbi:MAG: Stp1/IreP family PP2C-type Ser/Thr phosphatase [Deltaproteobacteria bacterium]|nr:Stp1/IreP family PP2C-type Ser/Thr phosphatase [Deltaproteobacteria bacterium]